MLATEWTPLLWKPQSRIGVQLVHSPCLALLGRPKKRLNFFSRNGLSLAGKSFRPLVAVFCTHLEPPNCHISENRCFCLSVFVDFPENRTNKVCPISGEFLHWYIASCTFLTHCNIESSSCVADGAPSSVSPHTTQKQDSLAHCRFMICL